MNILNRSRNYIFHLLKSYFTRKLYLQPIVILRINNDYFLKNIGRFVVSNGKATCFLQGGSVIQKEFTL